MDTKDWLQHLGGHIKRDQDQLPDEVIQGFLRVLEDVRREDMSCSHVFARLDEYVEKELRGEDAARIMPLLREHLDLCPDCCDEYEALLNVVERFSGSNSKTNGGV